MNFSEKDYFKKVEFIELLYENNKKLILTHRDDSLIDLIFLLYKSFEVVSHYKTYRGMLYVNIFTFIIGFYKI